MACFLGYKLKQLHIKHNSGKEFLLFTYMKVWKLVKVERLEFLRNEMGNTLEQNNTTEEIKCLFKIPAMHINTFLS